MIVKASLSIIYDIRELTLFESGIHWGLKNGNCSNFYADHRLYSGWKIPFTNYRTF